MKAKHIMLIDDTEEDLYVLNYILTKHNIAKKISIKNSAMDALQYLNLRQTNPREFPDVIFLDIRMPAMDGFDFLEEFIKFPQAVKKKCDIIILTSSNNQDDIDRASKYPVVKKYLTKPLEQNTLLELSMLQNL